MWRRGDRHVWRRGDRHVLRRGDRHVLRMGRQTCAEDGDRHVYIDSQRKTGRLKTAWKRKNGWHELGRCGLSTKENF